ncbi:MAG: hypothetical protein JSW47_16360 [Phycisphaerales bacterium]|nr:MAG: hypothetical protein JSW47_16360 [Phycisphaerales bacterium]
MPQFDSEGRSVHNRKATRFHQDLAADVDLTMEQILENLNTTPIGQVLKNIASLPEIRQEKVLHVRQQLTEGRYELSERLDIALDRVLEDLTA